MKRRTFLASVIGLVGGLLGLGVQKAVASKPAVTSKPASWNADVYYCRTTNRTTGEPLFCPMWKITDAAGQVWRVPGRLDLNQAIEACEKEGAR